MRVMHGSVFTSAMCMNGYIITIQTFTNLEKEKIDDCAPRSPSMQTLSEILAIHKLFSIDTSCSRSVGVSYVVAPAALSLAIVRKTRCLSTDFRSEL